MEISIADIKKYLKKRNDECRDCGAKLKLKSVKIPKNRNMVEILWCCPDCKKEVEGGMGFFHIGRLIEALRGE